MPALTLREIGQAGADVAVVDNNTKTQTEPTPHERHKQTGIILLTSSCPMYLAIV